MSEPIIKVEGLGKKYIISHEEKHNALRDVISHNAKKLVQKEKTVRSKEEFWALKDVSFEVNRGDAVGIIGRNGAGKSTLLKILSRITEPTHGRIEINGRVASLLEVGTGFHQELTGRENIFLNGAILGMSRAEIKKKFDEIVDFSGVEKFLDTPVKRYSSGMYVRLAFSVAAHLEPEILIVDEVLAVGDAEFQKKCLGKMNEVSKGEGRTVLFVSHNISAIKTLCNKGIYLQNGVIKNAGDVNSVANDYYKFINDGKDEGYRSYYIKSSDDGSDFDIIEASLKSGDSTLKYMFSTKENIYLQVTYKINKKLEGGLINFSLNNKDQVLFLSFDTDLNKERLETRIPGTYTAEITIPALTLKPGNYTITFNTGIANFETYSKLEECLSFSVILADENESFISYAEKRPGVIAMPLDWKTASA